MLIPGGVFAGLLLLKPLPSGDMPLTEGMLLKNCWCPLFGCGGTGILICGLVCRCIPPRMGIRGGIMFIMPTRGLCGFCLRGPPRRSLGIGGSPPR